MNNNTIKSAILVIASMTLAMPLLLGMVEIGSAFATRSILGVALSFLIWAIAATYIILHFLEKDKVPPTE